MSMSLEERRRQSVESPPSTNTTHITTKSDTPNQQRHQLTVTSLNHHYTNENHRSSPTTIQSCQAAVTSSTLKPQQSQTDIMAMHNFGPNSSQHEQQLKNQQQTNSGTDSTSWHNNNNSNNINNNNNNEGGSSNTGNNDHVNESQQSSVANNPNYHKVSLTDSSKSQANSRSSLNRQQQQVQHQQQHQPQLQSQSQQYHGIFSPQIPAILHSTLASRVDQIIRTTLHDSPAYTPPSSRNNNAGNNTNVITSTPSSNMPQPSSSSSLIFNTATGSMSTTSTPQNISSHPSNSSLGLMSNATTTAPITSLYGSTLSNMGDNLMSASNSNLAKTSPSHSALSAAAALQSLNQSHVQRSQHQQLAHTQPSSYSSVPGAGSATKPPSNGNGTPMPQAAHGGGIHQMSRLNVSSMGNSDQHNHLSFPSEQSNVGSLNFSSRLQPNNNLGNPKMVSQPSTIGLSNMNWQDQVHANGLMPRLPPLHGLNGPLPTYSTSSPRNPYGIMNPQLQNSLGSSNGNNMIGSDSDTLSKLSSMQGSPGQNNPMQFRDEKSFPMNFPTLLSNKQNQPNLDNLRGPPPNLTNESTIQANIANEKLVVFAYNLLSQGVPGKPLKKIVHLDDDMKNAIQNGEFYSKFGHIASGIINNQIIVPNFSIIDYLRKDIFVKEEVDTIERINDSLGISDLMCLMELVRQRPWNDRSGPEPGKPPQYPDIGPTNVGSSGLNCQPDHLSMTNLHHNSPHKGSPFLSSSPNRSDLLGPQGIDRSRRSSQSPSDISRSQLGNNASNSKFINTHNPNHVHQQQAPIINSHQFTSPLCPPNQQQQHTPPQNNRTSPFQPPMSIGPSHTLTRPPRSHSTIVGLSTGSFNPPYALTSPQVRQPPAAHQSSSRPNFAGLDMHLISAHTSPSSVPVTAHMSSKTPQTPKLQDSLPRPSSKNVSQVSTQFGNNKPGVRDPVVVNQVEFQNHPGRFDLNPSHVMSLQTHVGLRNQDLTNRELSMKRSTTPQYLPNNMLGPGANQIDLGRQQELMDGSLNSQSQMNTSHTNVGNYSINSRDLYNRNLNNSGPSNSNMPPPLMDPRQLTNDLSARNINFAPGIPNCATNDSQVKQYNAIMAAYQQQFMMSGKVGENHNPSGPVNMMSQVPAYMIMNQPGSQRPSVGEPMHIDIMQQAKQPQSQIGSPKLNNQRSIITGSGSASARKSKKAKPSPPASTQSFDTKTSANDQPPAQGTIAHDSSSIMSTDQNSHQDKGSPTTSLNPAINSSMNPAISANIPQSSSTQLDVVDTALGNTAAASPGASTAGIACITTKVCDENPNENVAARGIISPVEAPIKIETDSVPEYPKIVETSNVVQSEPSTKSNDNTENNQYIKSESSTESKQPSNSNCLPIPPIVDQPSKYQKLFTKKAWLKNYDLEDQARINGENLTTDDKMPVATRSSAKIEDKPEQINQPSVEPNQKETKPLTTSVKTNGGAKNVKTKVDGKKKAKEGKAKKANSVNSFRAGKVSTIKSTDHDSEETNASTSDLDDTDETDSLRSTSDKKLRRMPRRKVKLSSDRESSEQTNMPNKTKTHKDSSDKETVVRGRAKKEKTSNVSADPVSGSAKRKYNSDDESVKQKTKKIKESVIKHLEKSGSSPISKAKKRAGEKFLQTQPCYEIVPKSIRCLECRRVRQSSVKGDKVVQSKQASKTNWDDFCRFFEFRKLRYNKSAQIVVAGFSEASDAKESDMQLWLPLETSDVPKNISYDVAKFILANIGDEFCKLVSQERLTLESYESMSGDKRIVWKRAVNGLRELCDVCSTTLFNCHYVCDRCGFVVCIDCHESRAQNQDDNDATGALAKREISDTSVNCENNNTDVEQITVTNKKSKKDLHGWIFCAKNEEHSHDKLTLTKIIAGNCLEEVWASLHEIRDKLNLGECCCKKSIKSCESNHEKVGDIALNGSLIKQEATEQTEGSHSTLKGLLLASNDSPLTGSVDAKQQTTITLDAVNECQTNTFDEGIDNRELDFGSEDDSRQVSAAIEGCIASLAVEGGDDNQMSPISVSKSRVQDINFNPLSNTSSRLCNGDLLVLTHARHKDNIRLFREHWRHGKPVLVRGVHDRMNIDMWLPQFFLGKFGDYRSDLVDCRNGDIHRQSMRKYWDGFEPSSSKKKSKEDTVPGHIPAANNEEPSAVSTSYYSGSALWRLKDWPPGQDFNEILPEHYDDFMNNLPLKSYTTRTGKLNLACRLPKEMLKPDLGPKMYSAYGTTKFPERGTTNLHLDISDAVNVMVYVGGAMPFKQGSSEYSEIYDSTINDCYVDPVMKDQIRQNKLIPGALWHIFRPSDVTKIREFLNKVSDECKLSKEKRIDPIHDQIWYLDQNLLDRLLREYGVKSYPILQCMGDAILIPAGAPHQVKNLQNCIKVANDFVSPENIRYCLQLTNEFRNLPETHINQEDKLQIKNIMYHSVKESIQYIKMIDSGKGSVSDESSDEENPDGTENFVTNQTKTV